MIDSFKHCGHRPPHPSLLDTGHSPLRLPVSAFWPFPFVRICSRRAVAPPAVLAHRRGRSQRVGFRILAALLRCRSGSDFGFPPPPVCGLCPPGFARKPLPHTLTTAWLSPAHARHRQLPAKYHGICQSSALSSLATYSHHEFALNVDSPGRSSRKGSRLPTPRRADIPVRSKVQRTEGCRIPWSVPPLGSCCGQECRARFGHGSAVPSLIHEFRS